jgi:hypothetical protein
MTGYTARWFLAPDENTLTRSVSNSGVLSDLAGSLGRLSHAGHAAVAGELAAAVANLLTVDLRTILTDGWRTGAQLRKAAHASIAEPNSSIVVDLARHRLSYTYQPHIDLLVDGHPVASLPAALSLVFDIASAQATVHAGRLSALRCGQTNLTAALTLASQQIISKTGSIDAALVAPLGDGAPLLTPAEMAAGQTDATVPLQTA